MLVNSKEYKNSYSGLSRARKEYELKAVGVSDDIRARRNHAVELLERWAKEDSKKN